jgi:hypothetical protein
MFSMDEERIDLHMRWLSYIMNSKWVAKGYKFTFRSINSIFPFSGHEGEGRQFSIISGASLGILQY